MNLYSALSKDMKTLLASIIMFTLVTLMLVLFIQGIRFRTMSSDFEWHIIVVYFFVMFTTETCVLLLCYVHLGKEIIYTTLSLRNRILVFGLVWTLVSFAGAGVALLLIVGKHASVLGIVIRAMLMAIIAFFVLKEYIFTSFEQRAVKTTLQWIGYCVPILSGLFLHSASMYFAIAFTFVLNITISWMLYKAKVFARTRLVWSIVIFLFFCFAFRETLKDVYTTFDEQIRQDFLHPAIPVKETVLCDLNPILLNRIGFSYASCHLFDFIFLFVSMVRLAERGYFY